MGVFARLLRRSKAAEEASTVEAQADTPTAEPVTEEAAAAAEAKEPAETKADEATESTAARSTAAESVETDADDSVEIPKQQSADETADSEAGEGART
ncbi:hypothetical protein SAMN04487981_13244 [Streptomyces sp. cf386]|uniref:hypothetical protein n=1 Tax=Streptomyces sp. cf386 TaxID=1761904 RepID=UPI00088BFF2F|nr:hypothetical protein [Streptomyces sp. cf386]SDP67447.1 hypothetical protein SAMN04487981_13244 [Streptomyces sp. cf386]